MNPLLIKPEGFAGEAVKIRRLFERRFHTMGTEVRVLVGARSTTMTPSRPWLRPRSRSSPWSSIVSCPGSVPTALLDSIGIPARWFLPPRCCVQRWRPGCGRLSARAAWLTHSAAPARGGGLCGLTQRRRSEPLEAALSSAPSRRPAGPAPDPAWRSIEVLDEEGAIRRPPGVRFDSGGTGKGLAADMVGRRLADYARYAVDCGGDVRVGGKLPDSAPVELQIRHPLTDSAAESFSFERGAVATSGIDARLWLLPDGTHAHHLIDPSNGEPAWTGLICAAARAPTALEADVLAKAALLSGPDGAAAFLSEHGGLIVRDDGSVERIGPLHDPPRLRIQP